MEATAYRLLPPGRLLNVAEERPPLFSRELPGGGEVRVEALDAPDGEGTGARVVVERRSDPRRRSGHSPPVIAEAFDPSAEGLVERLLRLARDNVAIAAALQRWQRRNSGSSGRSAE